MNPLKQIDKAREMMNTNTTQKEIQAKVHAVLDEMLQEGTIKLEWLEFDAPETPANITLH